MSTCPHFNMSPCPHVPMSTCPHVHMSPCPHVPMSTCPHVPMSPCPHVPMSTFENMIPFMPAPWEIFDKKQFGKFEASACLAIVNTNFILSVGIEIPSYVFCVFVIDRWGRRPILSFTQIVSSVACIYAGLLTSVPSLSDSTRIGGICPILNGLIPKPYPMVSWELWHAWPED